MILSFIYQCNGVASPSIPLSSHSLFQSLPMDGKDEKMAVLDYRERWHSLLTWEVNDKCQLRLNRIRINTQAEQKGLALEGGAHARVRGYGIEWKIKLD